MPVGGGCRRGKGGLARRLSLLMTATTSTPRVYRVDRKKKGVRKVSSADKSTPHDTPPSARGSMSMVTRLRHA